MTTASSKASPLAPGDGRGWRSSEGSTECQGSYTRHEGSFPPERPLSLMPREVQTDGPSGGGSSLTRRGLGVTHPSSPTAQLAPGVLAQGLPALVPGQHTLNGEILYPLSPPALPPPPSEAQKPLSGQQPLPLEGYQPPLCPDAGWLVGTCEHNTTRWVRLSCKRRTCPVCGAHRQRLIAWRIAYGVEHLSLNHIGAWFVGTFDRNVSKKRAVDVQRKFIRWLRRDMNVPCQYAATWEVTRSGRLHLNLILAPWFYVPQMQLSWAWKRFGGGSVVWIQQVGSKIGNETAKVGEYLGKWEQMVLTGKGVTYSKNWPKLPSTPQAERQGKITWGFMSQEHSLSAMFRYECSLNLWLEFYPGEYSFAPGEECSCFQRAPP